MFFYDYFDGVGFVLPREFEGAVIGSVVDDEEDFEVAEGLLIEIRHHAVYVADATENRNDDADLRYVYPS